MIEHKTNALVVEQEGKFLLVKRANRPEKGYWAIPGGHVDQGESLWQSAQREGKEEVGNVRVEKKPFMDFRHDVRIGHRHHAHIFRAKPVGKIRAGSDAASVSWFTLDQMKNMNLTHYTKRVFNRLFPKVSAPDWHRKH